MYTQNYNVFNVNGFQIKPKWRPPGVIPKNVAIVMEKSRLGYYKALREEDAAKKKLAYNVIQERKKRIFEHHRNVS